jgi:hypothetical protein
VGFSETVGANDESVMPIKERPVRLDDTAFY